MTLGALAAGVLFILENLLQVHDVLLFNFPEDLWDVEETCSSCARIFQAGTVTK